MFTFSQRNFAQFSLSTKPLRVLENITELSDTHLFEMIYYDFGFLRDLLTIC